MGLQGVGQNSLDGEMKLDRTIANVKTLFRETKEEHLLQADKAGTKVVKFEKVSYIE